jgi:hypothetical protein
MTHEHGRIVTMTGEELAGHGLEIALPDAPGSTLIRLRRQS